MCYILMDKNQGREKTEQNKQQLRMKQTTNEWTSETFGRMCVVTEVLVVCWRVGGGAVIVVSSECDTRASANVLFAFKAAE